MQLFANVGDSKASLCLQVNEGTLISDVLMDIEKNSGIPSHLQRLVFGTTPLHSTESVGSYIQLTHGCTINVLMNLNGGMDRQNRAGSRPGAGAPASESQASLDRRERLRQLALETVDLSKDPYFMKNHLGSFECKLCLTLHNNEGNYLAHTQGRKHQVNLARRAAKDATEVPTAMPVQRPVVAPRRTIKIGRPGYKVVKQLDPVNDAKSLLFSIAYPEHAAGIQPRHRFMSSYEQRLEPADKNYQYLLFACEPYETIGFKIPNNKIDKSEGRFFSNWDKDGKTFTLQLYYVPESEKSEKQPAPPPPRPKLRFH